MFLLGEGKGGVRGVGRGGVGRFLLKIPGGGRVLQEGEVLSGREGVCSELWGLGGEGAKHLFSGPKCPSSVPFPLPSFLTSRSLPRLECPMSVRKSLLRPSAGGFEECPKQSRLSSLRSFKRSRTDPCKSLDLGFWPRSSDFNFAVDFWMVFLFSLCFQGIKAQ